MSGYFGKPAHLTERFDRAVLIACEHHRHRVREDGGLYVAKLFGVASIALDMGCDEDEAIAAVLLELLEDGGGKRSLVEILREFGGTVAEIVDANSHSYLEPKRPWRTRMEESVACVAGMSPSAVRVALADKLYTARAIETGNRREGERFWARLEAGDAESMRWCLRAHAAAFDDRAADEDVGVGFNLALETFWNALDQIDVTRKDTYEPPYVEGGWRQRFPDAWLVRGFEGGALYAADAEGAYWVIVDEGTMAAFIDPVEDGDLLDNLVNVRRFADAKARDAVLDGYLRPFRDEG